MMKHYLYVNNEEGTNISYTGHGQRMNYATGLREDPELPPHPMRFGPYERAVHTLGMRVRAKIMQRLQSGDETVKSLPIEEVLEEIPLTGMARFSRNMTARKLIDALHNPETREKLISEAIAAHAEYQKQLESMQPLDRFISEINIEEALKILASGNSVRINALVARALAAKSELDQLETDVTAKG